MRGVVVVVAVACNAVVVIIKVVCMLKIKEIKSSML